MGKHNMPEKTPEDLDPFDIFGWDIPDITLQHRCPICTLSQWLLTAQFNQIAAVVYRSCQSLGRCLIAEAQRQKISRFNPCNAVEDLILHIIFCFDSHFLPTACDLLTSLISWTAICWDW